VPLSSQKRVTEEKNPEHHSSDEEIEFSETHSELLKKREPNHHRHRHPVLNPNKIQPKKPMHPRKLGHQKPQ